MSDLPDKYVPKPGQIEASNVVQAVREFRPSNPLATDDGRDHDEIDLIALLRTIWRGKWLIALSALLFGAGAVAYLLYVAVPTYEATSTVALESRQPQVVDIESVVSGLGGDQQSINTEVEVLRSRTLLGAVVNKLDLTNDPEFNSSLKPQSLYSVGGLINAAMKLTGLGTGEPKVLTQDEQRNGTIDAVGEALAISNVRQSFVFRISATTEDPIKSRDLANVTADLYLENQLEAKFDATQRATTWLSDRVAVLQVTLEDAEQAVKDFNVKTDLIGIEVLEAQERQVKEMRTRTADATLDLSVAKEALESLKATSDPAELVQLTNDPTLRRLIDNAAPVETLNARRDQIISRANVVATRARNQLSALKASLVELEQQNAKQAVDLVELRQLQREAEASRLIYEYFLSRLKETSVQQGIQQADARILSLAIAPIKAASPRKSLTLVAMVLLGTLLGAALVVLREITQSTYRTSELLESDTGYSVIGQIPVIPVKKRQKVMDYLIEKPTSAAVEAIRNLRTTVLLQDIDNPPKVILSTSSMPSEGKTTQSIGLALNLAAMGRKVLLIEGDMRRRVFGEYFDIPGKKGLVSVLTGQDPFEEIVHHDKKLGIDVLQGEGSRVNAADLYSSNTFKSFLADMRERYDLIIFDTPPVLLVPDARIVAQSVDSIIYTVKWDETPKAQVRRGLKLFESVGRPVNGLVLSQVDPKGLKLYGYGDYSNSSYYEEA